MATIKVRWVVDELSNVMTQYDQVKVYRSSTKTGTYSEITGPTTRVDLVVDEVQYEYIDNTAPDVTYWYRTSYYNSSSGLESSMSSPIQGTDPGMYISLQDLRDEDISTSELSDERALSLIIGWQAWLERMCGQFFVQREETVDFDGDGSRLLLLPLPIIECTELYINDDFDTPLDTSYYVVYNNNTYINDDRKNPKIKLKRNFNSRSIYRLTSSYIFEIGDRNQRIVGKWGYVESDGTTPLPIKKAIKMLVIASKEYLSDSDLDQLKVGRIVEEVTDRHRIEYSDLYNRLQTWAPTGLTEVDLVIQSYRRPMRINAPRPVNLFV